MAGVTHVHLALTPITWHLWRQFKGILLHPRFHCKHESLLPRKPPCDVPCRAQSYICKKAISEKYEEDVACVRHTQAGLRRCSCLSCGACVPGSLPSVVLTHSSFDIAYSYWYIKRCCVKSECRQLCDAVHAAGRPGVVLSDRYVTLCGSIEHRSPKSRQIIQYC